MSWTHPICGLCWNKRAPDRMPHRLKVRERETCGWCGNPTCSGIYLREDPAKVPHPAL